MRYTLAEAEHGHVWGRCADVEGLFGDSGRGTYELFDWIPERADRLAWLGSRVCLVPDDETLGVWLLEDAEIVGRGPAGSLVLTALDDHEGPPEGYRGRVRVHDGYRALGSCQEFTRILPPDAAPPPLVLRGLAPGDRLRAALEEGTRRALDLGDAALEIRDDEGELLSDRPLSATVSVWRPSSCGAGLIDLELDAGRLDTVPTHARPVWERWFSGPPGDVNAWAALDTRRRGVWHELVRDRACRRSHRDRSPGHAYELDGRFITDEPALYLALGEAVNGPGGYFGGCLAALDDCLGGAFGYTGPAPLLWRDAAVARAHLSDTLTGEGRPHDLFAAVLQTLADGGVDVTLA
ncbi:hypothetical protein [Streptomyces sp. NPDC088785]|uniref:barstar family protein n=1 Tax=Streptomyces sp. NPDC088785 TaxID=3365897 RepID=UPI0038110E44